MHHGKVEASANRASVNRVKKAKPTQTPAARYNRKVLRSLENAISEDPEADLAGLLTSKYIDSLQSFKFGASAVSQTSPTETPRSKIPFPDTDIRSRLDASKPSTIFCELSAELDGLLRPCQQLSASIVALLAKSEVLYESAWAASVMVFRLNENIVVKVTSDEVFDNYYFLFTSFIPGISLEKVWPQLRDVEKHAIKSQLETLLSSLRSLPRSESSPLGDVQEGGCQDARRGVRLSSKPIMNVQQFEDFIFAGSQTASPLYTDLLRSLMPSGSAACVFSHGDIRPANIIVRRCGDGSFSVAGIIDWESSGFYPEYWDCVKAANNLTPREQSDWYEYLPRSISPRQYTIQWLVDRVWDRSLVNS
ncbi:hypothetical protein CORC01_12973 [Colletotrichum orchidophilum]|uniref:Aminoglycoside phosphotransferase domain-containing protein n=1 Tax=Colletotrichum orchidophilum TaxID=1209926 RepID=A0A1G4ARL1_9PEZI|nr:uncharacterized protein CORC01_12973 [Colletotrichum orchidophilum]OHE91746.1 hypothetical protein CORC01_12973 [Colletotrichum orchidophilum]